MLKRNNTIKAFTLSEMIVVLIITSIVVGLAFSVLSLVQKQMGAIKQNFNKNTTLNILETTLWLDFNTYPNIQFNVYEETLKMYSEIDSTTYRFTKDFIVKDLDTFAIEIEKKTWYFNGKQIEDGVLDAIKLEASKTFQNQKLFIYKKNDAIPFMN